MAHTERAVKRQKFLEEDSSDEDGAGVPVLNINEEYAKRFEHNKKREERSRLEEKAKLEQQNDDNDSSSDDEDEDDAAELATADLDEEIMATLQAIKNKDPRRLDPKVTFYRDYEQDGADAEGELKAKKEKPLYLQDYHRQNYMQGVTGAEEEEEAVPTYQQEQDQLKRELVGSMHAAGKQEDDDDEEGDFLVAKSRSRHEDLPNREKKKKAVKITDADVKAADKDPETFLSNFMAARAWLPTSASSRFAPLEDDDSEDDARADEFEEAYNLRFEDPAKANEKLASFARDVGKYGVRKEEKTSRAKARDRDREKKDALKRQKEEDKARLRKLRIEEAEEKVKKIKEAAGLRGKDVDLDAWKNVIEGDFDDDEWEEEMKRRFGEDYYAAGSGSDGEGDSDEDGSATAKKRKAKKPKWDDDIDIADLIPDFDDGERPTISLSDLEDKSSDNEEADGGAPVPSSDDEAEQIKKPKSKKDRAKEKSEAKRAARKERMQIESIVDSSLPSRLAATSAAPTAGFRYRETSPTSFGLSARDILFADDTALNNFAGLKKMAAFRDEEKKRRDKKKFGKKARLKQWRRETFGDVEEPTGGFEKILGKDGEGVDVDHRKWGKKRKATGEEVEKEEDDAGGEGKRKKKRSKKNKT